MANDDYQGITFIQHEDGTTLSEDENKQYENIDYTQENNGFLLEEDNTEETVQNQTLEDTLLTVQELNQRLLALEQSFTDYKNETTKKFEHIEKKVKLGNRSLSERILEIQEDS